MVVSKIDVRIRRVCLTYSSVALATGKQTRALVRQTEIETIQALARFPHALNIFHGP